MNLHRLSRKSLDADGEDDVSISKHGACQRRSALNSDSECVGDGPISVRDMIRYYDSSSRQDFGQHSVHSQVNLTQKQSHTVLFSRKSTSQSGLEYQESPPPSKFNLLPTMPRGCFEKKISLNSNSNVCCKNCSACHCCQNRNLKSSVAAIEDVQRNDIATKPNVDNLAVLRNSSPSSATTKKTCLEFRDDMNASRQPPPNVRTVMQKNHLLSNDSAEEATCHPIETSYQSKTTIAKTANGE